jgi:predicted ATP-dependent protease
MNDKYKGYLADLGTLITEFATEAIQKNKSSVNLADAEKAFNTGYMMAFHRIVTLMQDQAENFGIEKSEINIGSVQETDFFGTR